jgi:hypothetical protein
MRRLTLFATLVGACTVLAFMASTAMSRTSSSGGTATAVYNAIPSKLPGSVPSEGFECCQTKEFGDEVGLGGPARNLKGMTVTMVSWGCESGHWYSGDCVTTPGATFQVPLTFTIYEDNSGDDGAVLAQSTQNVNIPYRPSADSRCTGDQAGKWYSRRDHTCYNGYAVNVQTDFAGAATVLPDEVIFSTAFNTTTSGYNPVGPAPCNLENGGCGYDSLNVGAWSAPNAPYVGTDIDPDAVFRNGSMENGWEGFRPLGAIQATK